MVRRTGNQRPVADRQESGHDKVRKRKMKDASEKASGSIKKFVKILPPSSASAVIIPSGSLSDHASGAAGTPPTPTGNDVERSSIPTNLENDNFESAVNSEAVKPNSEITSHSDLEHPKGQRFGTLAGDAESQPSGSAPLTTQDPAILETSDIHVSDNSQKLSAAGSTNVDLGNQVSLVLDHSDPSTWPNPLPSSTRDQLIIKGPLQKRLSKYPKTGERRFSNALYTKKSTQLNSKRDWLLYSEKTNSLFCYCCSLFSNPESSPWSNFGVLRTGFADFGHLTRGIRIHEGGQLHFAAYIEWKQYLMRAGTKHSVDAAAKLLADKEISFWKKVLRGMLDAVLFLAKNNLAFRGRSEKIGDPGCGNFLSLIELLSKYYPPLALHLQRIQKSKVVSYMSLGIQNEFISLCGKTVRSEILNKIKERKCYSILFDATPDCSHKEQISQVIRTVKISKSGCSVEENFIGFLQCDFKKGKDISAAIVSELEKEGLEISNCRGQGYDNGSNMAGIYNGVQAHIKRLNELAEFIPCAAHSLNLVGQNAVSKVLPAKLILGQIQTLYNFFSGSTQRWSILMKNVSKTVKSHSATRWSSKVDSVGAVHDGFEGILESLLELSTSESSNPQTLADAYANYHQISNFRFILGITVWNKILTRIDIASVALQKGTTDIDKASKHLEGLLKWLLEFKDSGFDLCLKDAKDKAEKLKINEDSGFQQRISRNRLPTQFRADGAKDVVAKSNIQKFEEEFFNAVMEQLVIDFQRRFESLRNASTNFNFLWGNQLSNSTLNEKRAACVDLATKYSKDLNE